MYFRLLPFFTLIPLIELYLLIKVGSLVGAGPTVLIVVGTGVVGTYLARQQGFQVWRGINQSLNQGEFPAEKLVDGLLVLGAGLLLITPGILTDLVGFLMLIPLTRGIFRRWLSARFSGMIQRGNRDMSGIFWSRYDVERDVTDSGDDHKVD